MRPSKNTTRIVLYGCLGIVVILACVVAGFVGYVIVTEKNIEGQLQTVYDSITPYPDSTSILEYSNFGNPVALVCGAIYRRNWRGTNAPFADVQKYYSDQFAGRNWKPSTSDSSGRTSFVVDQSTTVDLNLGNQTQSNYVPAGDIPAVAAARQNYQTVYALEVFRLTTNDCP